MKSSYYPYDENLIRLTIDKNFSDFSAGYLCFDIMADDPDNCDLNSDIEEIAYDLISKISKNRIVLYSAPYKEVKKEQRKLFGRGWRPARFNNKGATACLREFLIQTEWNDGIFSDIVNFYESKVLWQTMRTYRKSLYILQENLDMELLKKCDVSYKGEDICGISIQIFPESKIKCLPTPEEMIRFYLKNASEFANITADIVLPRMYVGIDTNLISTDEFINILKPILKKHNKTLEVNI